MIPVIPEWSRNIGAVQLMEASNGKKKPHDGHVGIGETISDAGAPAELDTRLMKWLEASANTPTSPPKQRLVSWRSRLVSYDGAVDICPIISTLVEPPAGDSALRVPWSESDELAIKQPHDGHVGTEETISQAGAPAEIDQRLMKWLEVSANTPTAPQRQRRVSWSDGMPTDSGPIISALAQPPPGDITSCLASSPGRAPWSDELAIKQDAAHTIVPSPASHLALKPDRPTKVVAGISLGQGVTHSSRVQGVLPLGSGTQSGEATKLPSKIFAPIHAAHTIVPSPASHLALKPDRPTKVVAGISIGQGVTPSARVQGVLPLGSGTQSGEATKLPSKISAPIQIPRTTSPTQIPPTSPKQVLASTLVSKFLPTPEVLPPSHGTFKTVGEKGVLERRKGTGRPSLFSVGLTLSEGTPRTITGVYSLVDKHGQPTVDVRPGDVLIEIDTENVVQADTDVIRHLLSSNSKNTLVLLKVFSREHQKNLECELQCNICVCKYFDWRYTVRDEYAGKALMTNPAIVDVLEDMRLRLTDMHGKPMDLLSLDVNEEGGTSLGFRIEWDLEGTLVNSLTVSHVTAGGCADSKLQVGDLITAIENCKVQGCQQGDVIRLLRGDGAVGSFSNLLVGRHDFQFQVRIRRTRASQLRDSNTLQLLCAKLEFLTRGIEADGVKEIVQQLFDHSVGMEKNRSQREVFVSKKVADLQATLLDSIGVAEIQLQPAKWLPPPASDLFETFHFRHFDFSLDSIVSALDGVDTGLEESNLDDLLQFVNLHLEQVVDVVKKNTLIELVRVFYSGHSLENVVENLRKQRQDANGDLPEEADETEPLPKINAKVAETGAQNKTKAVESPVKSEFFHGKLNVPELMDRRLDETGLDDTSECRKDLDEKGLYDSFDKKFPQVVELMTVKKANMRLAQELAGANMLIERHRAEALELKRQITHLESQMASSSMEVYERIEEANRALLLEIKDLKVERDRQASARDQLELQLQQQKEKLIQSESNYQTETSKTGEKMVHLQHELEHALQHAANTKEQASRLQQELDNSYSKGFCRVLNLQQELEQALQDAANAREQASQQVSHLQQELKSAQQRVARAEQQATSAQRYCEAITLQSEGHQMKAIRAVEELKAVQADLARHDEAYSKAAENLRATTDDLLEATKEIARLNQDLDQRNARIVELQRR